VVKDVVKVSDGKTLSKLDEANDRLKAANVGLSILNRNNKLYLRGILPPKNGEGKPKRQEIAIGARATAAGIRFAEAEARKVGALVDCREFAWDPYLKAHHHGPVEAGELMPAVAEVVQRFEEAYFQRRARTPKSETTWKDYAKVFRVLPADQPVSEALLREMILATEPDTRTRQRFCTVLGSLATFAGLKLDTKPYKGNYSPKRVTPRNLPTDEEIAKWRDKLDHPAWQWAYGMMACYGLRNHEVFLVDPESLQEAPGIVTLLDDKAVTSATGQVRELGGKTGGRRIWPCYPEWWESWQLAEVKMPQVTARNNSDFGERLSHYFRRWGGIPFKPYDLRHCWAVRTLEFGLDVSLAAAQMGHSVTVHTELYHHWISERHHQRAFELLMQRQGRPLPPQ
jgi:integrase